MAAFSGGNRPVFRQQLLRQPLQRKPAFAWNSSSMCLQTIDHSMPLTAPFAGAYGARVPTSANWQAMSGHRLQLVSSYDAAHRNDTIALGTSGNFTRSISLAASGSMPTISSLTNGTWTVSSTGVLDLNIAACGGNTPHSCSGPVTASYTLKEQSSSLVLVTPTSGSASSAYAYTA